MTQEITAQISADIRLTLPPDGTVKLSTERSGVRDNQSAAIPPLPEPEPATEPEGSGFNGSADPIGDPLAGLPPELLQLGEELPMGAADVPPPSVTQLEAMVAAADHGLGELPPEVVHLEAFIDADSAHAAPPDPSELERPKRSSRKKK